MELDINRSMREEAYGTGIQKIIRSYAQRERMPELQAMAVRILRSLTDKQTIRAVGGGKSRYANKLAAQPIT